MAIRAPDGANKCIVVKAMEYKLLPSLGSPSQEGNYVEPRGGILHDSCSFTQNSLTQSQSAEV